MPTVDAEHTPTTLIEFVEGLARHGRRTAVIEYSSLGKQALDYTALKDQIRRAAARLSDAGIGPSSTVALWGPNGADWVVAYFGGVCTGALVVPLDNQSSAATLSGILDHASPGLIVTTVAHRAELAAACRTTRTMLSTRSRRARTRTSDLSGSQKMRWGARFEEPRPARRAALHLRYDGHSEGGGVDASQPAREHARTLRGGSHRCGRPRPAAIATPPHVSVYRRLDGRSRARRDRRFSRRNLGPGNRRGCEGCAPDGVARRAASLRGPLEQRLSTVERRGVWAARLFRALLGVCAAVRRVTGLRAGRWLFGSLHATFGGRLEVIGCGGAHLDPQLARRLEALGWTVLTGYGLTETSPVLTFNDRSNSRLGSEGRPLAGVEVAIRRTNPATPKSSRAARNRAKSSRAAQAFSVDTPATMPQHNAHSPRTGGSARET